MPRRGLLVDSLFKSGGNDFHGSVVLYGSGSALEGNNIDAGLATSGIRLPKLHKVQDFAGTLGGRIIRNKLWFFAGARYQNVTRDILDAFDPDGTPIANVKKGTYHFEKISYQVSAANRLTGFYHINNDMELRNASRFIPRESMLDKDNPVWIAKAEWQTVRGNSLVATVQYGQWDFNGNYRGISPGKQSTRDIATQFVTGNHFIQAANANGRRADEGRRHTKGAANWYKSDLFGGNHEFKIGVDHLWTWFDDGYLTPQAGSAYQLLFNNGAPFQIDTTNASVKGLNHGNYLGVYTQDSWTFARRLTLDLGLRVEHDAAHAPAQCHDESPFAAARCLDEIRLVTFNSLLPRVHVAFDLTGDAKTVIKGGYGRFNQLRELNPDLTNINQNVFSITTWDWHDLNGNKLYDPGEVNLDPNGADFRAITGSALGVVNPNERQPKSDELSLTFERELFANTSVRVTGMYARNVDAYALSEISRDGEYTIPVANLDPGPDGQLGTPDDTGRSFTYYEYPASLGGAAFARTMFVNDPGQDSSYKTFEVAIMKRPAQGWQLGMSYSSTWADVPISCGTSGSGLGSGTPVVWATSRCLTNPNVALNTADQTREWQAKLSGAYNLPLRILVSGNYDIRSGAPQARQVVFTGGRTIRSIALNVEPRGSFYLPNTHELDVRAAKRVSLGTARSLEVRFDIYNALNKNTVRAWNLQSGANYLRPSLIMFPRILQVGATFDF
jgi:outer membrane receptor protein involved in Fe transport